MSLRNGGKEKVVKNGYKIFLMASAPIQNHRSVLRCFSLLARLRSSLPERSLVRTSSQPGAFPKNENHSNSGPLFLGQSTRAAKCVLHFLFFVAILGLIGCFHKSVDSKSCRTKVENCLRRCDKRDSLDGQEAQRFNFGNDTRTRCEQLCDVACRTKSGV